MKTAKRDTSYIHVRIEPTPELEVKVRDLMREVHELVSHRLGDTARVTSTASMRPLMRPEDRIGKNMTGMLTEGPS